MDTNGGSSVKALEEIDARRSLDGLRRAATATPATRKKGDIKLLETIAKDPQAFILKQGWASVSIDGSCDLRELRSLYEFLQARILELIETLDELRASPDYELFQCAEKDPAVIDQVVEAQRVELEKEIGELDAEAERKQREIEELVGEVPF